MIRVSTLLALVTACAAAPNTPKSSIPTAPTTAAPLAPAVAGIAFLDAAPPDALALDVRVTPWSCAVTDPNGVFDEELHFPLGRTIRLNLHNDDRDHDVDVQIEDRIINLARSSASQFVFRVDHQGNYSWRCPVREGPNVRMDIAMPIFAHVPGDYVEYQRWQDEQTRPKTHEGRVRLGKYVYEKKGCNACHTDDGSPRVGVSFAGLWGRRVTLVDGSTHTVDDQFVKDSLVNPRVFRQSGYQDAMPSFEGYLRPEEMSAVASYIESLKVGAASPQLNPPQK
jgi:cytochrome c oxidase subunit 2